MRLISEEQLLSLDFREQIITEILGKENQDRKLAALKRYEVYQDKTVKWVIDKLLKEGLQEKTVALMSNRASNISICRKIIDKLARTYAQGVQRTTGQPETDDQISTLSKLVYINQRQKKADRYLELFKNTITQVVPERVEAEGFEGANRYRLSLRNLAPWQYDIIEDYHSREQAKVVILSDFVDRSSQKTIGSARPGAHGRDNQSIKGGGDGVDQIIADELQDQGAPLRTFIFWSGRYHFTTNEKGEILVDLSPEDLLNPIGILPFPGLTGEQNGNYWAQGGDDLIDGSVLINTLITDMFSIAYMQGWGQMVITGKNLPDKFQTGPHHALIIPYEEGEPKPDVTVVNANPPIDSWLKCIEQYVALLLSTNNLSPANIAMKLDANTFPSGIAMLIEQSESTLNMEDKQNQFADQEREIWECLKRWQNLYVSENLLVDEFMDVGSLPDFDLSIKFNNMKPIVTESEKIENLKSRKDLGLNTEIELILIDNPDMTEAQAKEKLLKIKQEKLGKLEAMMTQAIQASETHQDETKEPAEMMKE
jgi:hypothetical protein